MQTAQILQAPSGQAGKPTMGRRRLDAETSGDTRSTPRSTPAWRNRGCEERRDQVPSRGCRDRPEINRSKEGGPVLLGHARRGLIMSQNGTTTHVRTHLPLPFSSRIRGIRICDPRGAPPPSSTAQAGGHILIWM